MNREQAGAAENAEGVMEWAFESFPACDPLRPHRGELQVRARAESADRRELARLALARDALGAFAQGNGPVVKLVIQDDPTLDDMLAATFLEQRLKGRELPTGAGAFAAYAANVREGLRPTELPLRDSLEGIYLALRNEAGNDLSDPAARKRFVSRWSQMTRVILRAAEEGRDPTTTPLFANDPDFARDRTFLAEDRAIYEQQDVPRGERWRVRIPGGPPGEVGGLLLRDPRSILWKYWAREDPAAPGRKGYLFLAAFEKEKHWRFSTPSGQRLSIKGLAAKLQQAEVARNPAATSDPWSDGARFGHTLVGAPLNAGTALADAEVLRIVKRWAQARPADPAPRLHLHASLTALLVAAVLLLGAVATYLFWPKSPPFFDVTARVNNGSVRVLTEQRPKEGQFWAEFPAVLQPGSNIITLTAIGSVSLPSRLSLQLDSAGELPAMGLTVRMNGSQATTLDIESPNSHTLKSNEAHPVFNEGENTIDFQISNPANTALPAKVRVNWRVNWDFQRDVYLVNVGVKNYAKYPYPLDYADKDALDLKKAFKDQENKLFGKIICEEGDEVPLIDDQATKSRLLKRLKWLQETAKTAMPESLVVVTLAGHGTTAFGERFYFLPYDYTPDQEPEASAVSWDAIIDYLKDLPCPVVVVIDACHSGAAMVPTGLQGTDLRNKFNRSLACPMPKPTGGKGIVVLAACQGDQASLESGEWEHGALTLAVLEAMQERRIFKKKASTPLPRDSNRPEVTLKDLCAYAKARVDELAPEQAAATRGADGLFLDYIRIGRSK